MNVSIESRPYGPESTPAELEALRARVRIGEGGILFFEEVPVVTIFSVEVMWDQFEALVRGWPQISYVADLRRVQRPPADVRELLKKRVAQVKGRFGHVALVVGTNVVIRAMARLFAYSMGMPSVSLHSTPDEAFAEVRRVAAH